LGSSERAGQPLIHGAKRSDDRAMMLRPKKRRRKKGTHDDLGERVERVCHFLLGPDNLA
jgi:hypothetical protein